MARWLGAQGEVNFAKKVKTCHHYDVTPESLKQKNLFSLIEDLNSFLA